MLYRRGRRRWCDNIVIVKSIADIPCAYEIILGLSVNCCSSPTRSYSLLSIYLGNWSNRAKFVWDCVSVWISTTWNCLWRCESLLRVTDLICSVRGWCSLNNWMWWILCGRPVSQSVSFSTIGLTHCGKFITVRRLLFSYYLWSWLRGL